MVGVIALQGVCNNLSVISSKWGLWFKFPMTAATTRNTERIPFASHSSHVLTHDIFNLISLSIMIPIILLYCHLATEWDKIGTRDLGGGHQDLFVTFFTIFMIYLIVDTAAIALFPSCVVTDPRIILIHHCVLLPLCVIPYFHDRYHWHMIVGLTTEINTFFIVLRRQLPQPSLIYNVCNVLFYVTWVLLKLILFPCITVLFLFECVNYSNEVNTFVNITVIAPVLMAALTMLTFKWTKDMLIKMNSSTKKTI